MDIECIMLVPTADGMRLEHEELAEKLENKTHVSKRQAEVFVLRKMGGLSVEEVSEELNIGEGTISEHSKRYREKVSKAESLLGFKDRYC